MPRIGSIDVPDTLFEKLVEDSVKGFTADLFSTAEKEIDGLDLTAAREQLNADFPAEHEHLRACVAALIRMNTGNYTSSDGEIQSGEAFKEIWRTAYRLADQIGYDALPADSHLKGIADDNLKYLQP